MLDQFYPIPIDPHNIKPYAPVNTTVHLDIHLGRSYDMHSFAFVDRIKRGTERISCPSFDFDKNKETIVFRNDIYFPERTPEVGRQDRVAVLFQDLRGLALSFLPLCPLIRHRIPLLP